jgi:hypothetical protein
MQWRHSSRSAPARHRADVRAPQCRRAEPRSTPTIDRSARQPPGVRHPPRQRRSARGIGGAAALQGLGLQAGSLRLPGSGGGAALQRQQRRDWRVGRNRRARHSSDEKAEPVRRTALCAGRPRMSSATGALALDQGACRRHSPARGHRPHPRKAVAIGGILARPDPGLRKRLRAGSIPRT